MSRTLSDDVERADQMISSSVKQLLTIRDLTVADLSYNTGIPQSTIYRKLNNTQAWKSSDIARVALYLGVSPNALFSGRPLGLPSQGAARDRPRGRSRRSISDGSPADTREYSARVERLSATAPLLCVNG